jgi:hypothetical protein
LWRLKAARPLTVHKLSGSSAPNKQSFIIGGYTDDMRLRRQPANVHHSSAASNLLIGAAVVGGMLGIGSVATTPDGRGNMAAVAKEIGVASGVVRRRAPQQGDYWHRCDAARAAGTAPIYKGEPGYRDGLDGDGDGIACEPYRGQ